jgi:DNA-binding transcriptional ArsR family regulator
MGDAPTSATANGGPTRRPRDEQLMDSLGDPVIRRVLVETHHRPRSVQELFQATGVPLTTLYRKLHEMTELELVGIERSAITPDGKRVEFYRSRLEEVQVELKEGRFGVRSRARSLTATRMENMWGAARQEAGR